MEDLNLQEFQKQLDEALSSSKLNSVLRAQLLSFTSNLIQIILLNSRVIKDLKKEIDYLKKKIVEPEAFMYEETALEKLKERARKRSLKFFKRVIRFLEREKDDKR